MHSEYIGQRNGGYHVAGTRISLDSIVYAFNRGETPEQIFEANTIPLSEANPALWEKLQRARSQTGERRS
jgi:hypothetical protein